VMTGGGYVPLVSRYRRRHVYGDGVDKIFSAAVILTSSAMLRVIRYASCLRDMPLRHAELQAMLSVFHISPRAAPS